MSVLNGFIPNTKVAGFKTSGLGAAFLAKNNGRIVRGAGWKEDSLALKQLWQFLGEGPLDVEEL